ncbi:agmatine deiminase family protein [Pontibacter lucknowensis]|uniref:Porphyromonas-type peptidyl-arginine deiminase n=1 Tax=Pontibacter lucknowensis TaxID=1077936 RepID=A0A1N6XAW9_9BACT|nr:agmatine deiminase family protein [Pontibacter lucknowensis]SIQ99463.1 Porphyromonas-type peptidyl-arginine deiminase [Pontibacter lucknowensis]
MINDRDTNFVYFSSLIKERPALKSFWLYLEKQLHRAGIDYGFIENTNDIWCRDYMPVQISPKAFVQFKYYPSYCNTVKYRPSITDTAQVQLSNPLPGTTVQHPLLLDGGNVVRSGNTVVMTDRVFKENKTIAKEDVIAQLKQALQVEKLYLIPSQPYDFTGHSDGMVRFVDDHTLLVADYRGELDYWKTRYRNALQKTGLRLIEFPAAPVKEKNKNGDYPATRCYINFAWIGDVILFPQFDMPEDEEALKEAKRIFNGCQVIPVPSAVLAEDGGVLNCATWNVKT